MTESTVNGCHVRVWSMSIMGWRYLVTHDGEQIAAGTKRTERAAEMAARKAANAHQPEPTP